MAEFSPAYQPVLNTSAQPTRAEMRAGIPNEWSRDGEMHSVALRRSAIPGLAVPGLAVPGVGLPPVGLLMQTVVEFGEKTDDGLIVQAVTLPWFAIVAALQRDPAVAFQLTAEQWEHMVAGAYDRAGFDEVILTPRSGDFGRDVIATKYGLGTVRVIDQVKAYGPGHLVTADDVRALLGVLDADGASKGFLTTTSDFAPRLPEDRLLKKYLGSQLELVNGTQLLRRLKHLATR
jgi:restriction system protein